MKSPEKKEIRISSHSSRPHMHLAGGHTPPTERIHESDDEGGEIWISFFSALLQYTERRLCTCLLICVRWLMRLVACFMAVHQLAPLHIVLLFNTINWNCKDSTKLSICRLEIRNMSLSSENDPTHSHKNCNVVYFKRPIFREELIGAHFANWRDTDHLDTWLYS